MLYRNKPVNQMKITERHLSLLLFLLIGSTAVMAQQKEFKKLQKEGLTTESLVSFTDQFPDFAPAQLKLADSYDMNEQELALKHYEKALSMMNDEETKINAKFYEDYKQRDFRSGKIVLKTDYLVEYIEEKIKKNKGSE